MTATHDHVDAPQEGRPEIRLDRLRYWESRFKVNELSGGGNEEELLVDLKFESLWSELARVSTMDSDAVPYRITPQLAGSLSRAGAHVSTRLSNALVRWFSLRWLQTELGSSSSNRASPWRRFAELAIKDAHVDTVSLVDSLAPFILMMEGCEFDPNWVPGFGQLLDPREGKSPGKWRESLGEAARELVDSAEGWFSFVQNLRNHVVHKKQMTLIFGHPFEVLAFQILLPVDSPAITNEALLLKPAGGPIVDFSLYGVWMLAESVCLIDSLAGLAMDRFGIDEGHLPLGGRPTSSESPILAELRRLIERVDESP